MTGDDWLMLTGTLLIGFGVGALTFVAASWWKWRNQ